MSRDRYYIVERDALTSFGQVDGYSNVNAANEALAGLDGEALDDLVVIKGHEVQAKVVRWTIEDQPVLVERATTREGRDENTATD